MTKEELEKAIEEAWIAHEFAFGTGDGIGFVERVMPAILNYAEDYKVDALEKANLYVSPAAQAEIDRLQESIFQVLAHARQCDGVVNINSIRARIEWIERLCREALSSPQPREEAKPDPTGWECNECGHKEYTMAISEDEVHELQCSNCGANEFHES